MESEREKTPNLERLLDIIEQNIDGALINQDETGFIFGIPIEDYEMFITRAGNSYSLTVKGNETKGDTNEKRELLNVDSSLKPFDRYADRFCKLYDKMLKGYKKYQEILEPLKKADNQAYQILKGLGEIDILPAEEDEDISTDIGDLSAEDDDDLLFLDDEEDLPPEEKSDI